MFHSIKVTMLVDVLVLDVVVVGAVSVQVREVIVFRCLHDVLGPAVAIPVHYHVVGNAHNPCCKLARGYVFALLQFGDDLHEGLLEYVIRQILLVNDKENI